MVWYNVLICFGIGIVHFFSTTIDDCSNAIKNVKQVFATSECKPKEKDEKKGLEKSDTKNDKKKFENKLENKLENKKYISKKNEHSTAENISKTFSLTKKISKSVKSVGSAGVDIALDVSLAGCQEFRNTPLGKIASLLDCDPDKYDLFSQN